MFQPHQPVLYQEIIHALRPKSGGRYVDGTLGAGGHAAGLLAGSEPGGRLLGLDVDPQALDLAHQNLAPFGERAWLTEASYTSLPGQLAALGWDRVDGILLDLGASSMQFDTARTGLLLPGRRPAGYALRPVEPADRRRDRQHLAGRRTGRRAFSATARNVPPGALPGPSCTARPIERHPATGRCHRASHQRRHGPHHPATQTFQALRIAVNGELESVEKVLPLAVQALGPGGRLAVISFHSLEDRLVKEYFRLESKDCICPPNQPVCTCGHKASIKEITRRPIMPTEEEINQNSRARSAKLRVAEKL